MRVGVPRETWPGETRVSLIPAAIPALIFYNYFMGKVRQQRAGMDDFALEFINLAERNFT